jgi:hypothetical protein
VLSRHAAMREVDKVRGSGEVNWGVLCLLSVSRFGQGFGRLITLYFGMTRAGLAIST